MPDNFQNTNLEAYRMLPPIALPTGAASGKSNFTLKDAKGRTIQVQLANKCFYCVASGPKTPYKGTVGQSPQCSWASLGSVEAAWAEAVKRVGGWEPDQ